MVANSTTDRLTRVLRDVFENDELIATPNLTAQQVEGWDSLGQVRLLAKVEREFSIRFGAIEVASLNNIGELAEFTVQIRLEDPLGDNGMVAVLICSTNEPELWIDTWLMRCRVLNRRLEHATLNHLVLQARSRGARALIGEYVPTERNGIVEDHYARLGFERVEGLESHLWRLALDGYAFFSVPMEVVARPCL